ncbi:UNVERIFIED_CONTAM: hypothetical protein K2H54_025875 [Gekko kuhli]
MAPEKISEGSHSASPDPDDAIVTKRDFKEDRQILIQEISTLVKDLMQPLQTSLSDLIKEVKDTAKMAETASELALKVQSEVRAVQTTEQLTINRLATLENGVTGKAFLLALGLQLSKEEESELLALGT